MKVLVVGGGGREHALVHAFASSNLATQLYCAPGNAGIAQEAECVPIGAEDVEALLAFARGENVDVTVVGPEAPLVAGIADAFEDSGLAVFGPTKAAAQLEGSKLFAKEIMADAGAPTGGYMRFTDHRSALDHLASASYPVVVKANGLAAGKGVTVAQTRDEAQTAVDEALVARRFGIAGEVILIEEFLAGPEVSLLALCDGPTVVPMAPAQDYKRIFAEDQGPNTGGMGSYCPVPGFSAATADMIAEEIFQPVLEALARRGIWYRGVLYGGLIVTEAGTKLLEFNVRFGDPETQAILPRLESDLLELCLATARGELRGARLAWKPQDCVSVVLASKGYPASSSKGDVISGLDAAAAMRDVTVYHAGTAQQEGDVVTAGGRVLAVSALGEPFAAARELAYQGVKKISFPGMQWRPDIADRAVQAEQGELSLFPAGVLG
jgi:phosphoribosylamine--glycine ligase